MSARPEAKPPAPVRVVLADDHDVVRRGLAMVLGAAPDLHVVGEARDGAEAVEAVVRLRPDLVMLDVRMPRVDGVQAAKLIRRGTPEVRILMLTGITTSPATIALFQDTADACMLKDATPRELLEAVRCVAAGKPCAQGWIIRRLAGVLPGDAERKEQPRISTPLTARETEILHMMATSSTNRAIASRLSVGEETVRTHVKHILHKLDQPDRTKAVVAAVHGGLLDVG